MTTLTIETEPLAAEVSVNSEALIVELGDGRGLTIPLEWYPRLLNG